MRGECADAILVMPGAVAAMHAAQHAVTAALQGDMSVARDARRGLHEGDEFVAPVHGLHAADAEQWRGGLLEDGAEKIGEAQALNRGIDWMGPEVASPLAQVDAAEDDS